MEGEQLIGGVASNWLKEKHLHLFGYGIYATNKRLIGIKMRKGAAVWVLAGPAVGYYAGQAVTQAESEKALPELEEEKDLEVKKEEISKIEVKKPGTFARGHIRITLKSGEEVEIISSNKKDFKPIADLMKAFFPEALEIQE